MTKQVEEVETLQQAARLKTIAAEKFILDSKSDTTKKISLERSISRSDKENLRSKMSVLETSVSLLQEIFDKERKTHFDSQTKKTEDEADKRKIIVDSRCNRAHADTLQKQADESPKGVVPRPNWSRWSGR